MCTHVLDVINVFVGGTTVTVEYFKKKLLKER